VLHFLPAVILPTAVYEQQDEGVSNSACTAKQPYKTHETAGKKGIRVAGAAYFWRNCCQKHRAKK